jgi:1,4-alpha-glucan branching enzyme
MVTFNAKTKKTVFEIHLPHAHSVSLVAEFNGWSEDTHPLKKSKDGNWKVEVTLQPGKYQFLYRVDRSHWHADDKAARISNEFGTENCLAVVPSEAATPKPAKTAAKKGAKKK